MNKDKKKKLLIAAAILAMVIQFVPVDRSNPPVTGNFDAPPEIAAILRRSCYDCHSHETRWPWYGYVAPISWTLAAHVSEGRSKLNFSQWAMYSAKEKAHASEEIWEEVEEGKMPLPVYRWVHRNARLSADEKQALLRWLKSVQESAAPTGQ